MQFRGHRAHPVFIPSGASRLDWRGASGPIVADTSGRHSIYQVAMRQSSLEDADGQLATHRAVA